MTNQEFSQLEAGDIIANASDGRLYVVTNNYGTHVTAVYTVDMTNPPEWDLVVKVTQRVHVQRKDR